MKSFYIMVFLSLVALTSCEKKPVEPKDQVQKSFEAYGQDYNLQDPAKLAALWSPNGVYISAEKTIEGREQIEAFFKKLFQSLGKAKITIKTDNIDLDEPGKAYVDATTIISQANGAVQKSQLEVNYVNTNGSWLIESLEEIVIPPAPTHYEQLKELSSLVGSWQDDDPNIDSTSTMQWDYNKNFLIEKFTFSSPDQAQLEGLQIVGWDPSVKRIRSWIFDSDGGFGNAFWIKDNKTWNASTSYVLPDGRKASAIHTYTSVDDNTYMFSSESREVDGEFLPNIGPFKVVRTKK